MATERVADSSRRKILALIGGVVPLFIASRQFARAEDKSGFPDGYDAVQAAPDSHKVIFENAVVRVLEVIIPPPSTTEPMHHHRWPSFFLNWDTGGKTRHVHYLRPDGSARDEPSAERSVHPGKWSIQWMKPEPMHDHPFSGSRSSVAPDHPSAPRGGFGNTTNDLAF